MKDGEAIQILVVDDSPGDVKLTLEAFKEWKSKNIINSVSNGEEAINYLYKKGKYADSERPDLILLDLNMPKKNGREVLELIKEDRSLKTIPVIVLTTSKAEEDILKAYSLHANSYIIKSIDLDEFMANIKILENYWMGVVKLPSH